MENTAKEKAKERMTETQQIGSSLYAGIQYTVYASMFILGYSSRDLNLLKSVFVYLLTLPYACNPIF